MALKKSDGTIAKKQKINIIDSLYDEEIKKQKDDDRKEAFDAANKAINKDVADLQVEKIPINLLYAAPYNDDWNDFKKLNADAAYKLNQAIVDAGLLTPIIIWKLKKEQVAELYANNEDPYGFIGNEYMVLAGHSRVYSFVELYNATRDVKYTKIDATIKENITYEEARYIIKVSNFATRELSPEEKRRNIKYMYGTLSKTDTLGMSIAQKISNDSGCKLRTVQQYITINKKLIQEFIDMYDIKKITQGSAIKLARLSGSMQKWLYNEHRDEINDKVLKGLQKSYDKKEQIRSLFEKKDVVEYTKASFDIPKNKEKQFRKMVENWLSKYG